MRGFSPCRSAPITVSRRALQWIGGTAAPATRGLSNTGHASGRHGWFRRLLACWIRARIFASTVSKVFTATRRNGWTSVRRIPKACAISELRRP